MAKRINGDGGWNFNLEEEDLKNLGWAGVALLNGPARPAPARYGPRAKRAGPFRPVFKRAKFFKPKPAHLAGGRAGPRA